MLVAAKCLVDAYDSSSCQHFKMGSTYEIERDGPLASPQTNGGKTGKHVFEFDRNGTKTNDGVDVVKDYSCKKDGCGKKFKTLAELGRHTNSDHKNDPNPLAEPDAEVVVAKDLAARLAKSRRSPARSRDAAWCCLTSTL